MNENLIFSLYFKIDTFFFNKIEVYFGSEREKWSLWWTIYKKLEYIFRIS